MNEELPNVVNLLIISLLICLPVLAGYYVIQRNKFRTLKRKLDYYHLLASNCQWIFFEYDCENKRKIPL